MTKNKGQPTPQRQIRPMHEVFEMSEISKNFDNAVEILTSRVIAEPHNYAAISKYFIPTMLERLEFLGFSKLKIILQAAMTQYDEEHRYTALDIQRLTGIELFEIMRIGQLHSGFDLESAWSYFWDYYTRRMEIQISIEMCSKIANGEEADDVRAWTEQERKRIGLTIYAGAGYEDGKVTFERNLINAFDGKEPDYEVKPFLSVMRQNIPYYKPKDKITVGGRSGMGKTYFALNQMLYLDSIGVESVYINLEMDEADVWKRFWQMRMGLMFRNNMRDAEFMQRGLIEWERLKKSKIRIISNSGRDSKRIINSIRETHYEFNSKFCCIDYMQLCKDSAGGKIRTYELEGIVTDISECLMSLDVTNMMLVQLNRELDRTAAKRPTVADLKDTAVFESNSTFVLFPFRPSVYGITEGADGEIYGEKYADITCVKGRELGLSRWTCEYTPSLGFYDTPSPQMQSITQQAYQPQIRPNEDEVPF